MPDRPILFSGAMIRALLAGTKTQTRRIIKPQPPEGIVRHCWYDAPLYGFTRDHDVTADWHIARLLAYQGDRLWVKERGWISKSKTAFQPYVGNEQGGLPQSPDGTPYKVCVSIHMPRWASRLTLTVTDVRVERLQDISEEDAKAEGITRIGEEYIARGSTAWDDGPNFYTVDLGFGHMNDVTARDVYCRLWDYINGEGAWEKNPWVVAYSFSVERGNIDQIGRAVA